MPTDGAPNHWLIDHAASAASHAASASGVTIAACAVLLGILLWSVGGRLIKPAFLGAGAIFGAALGMTYLPGVLPPMALPGPWIGVGAGAVLGLLVALLVYRFAMGITGAAVFGVGALLGAILWLSATPGGIPARAPSADAAHEQSESVQEIGDRLRDAAQRFKDAAAMSRAATNDPNSAPADEQARREGLDAGKRTADEIQQQLIARWNALPERSRLIITVAWMAGALVGFLFGVTVPGRAAALITSLAGSAMWLSAAAWLAQYAGISGESLMRPGALGWLAIWAVATVIGMSVQSRRRQVARPAPAVAPAAA